MTPSERARQYLIFARLFAYPRPEVWEPLERENVVTRSRSQEEREAEYLAAFELGGERPPVSLYEGLSRPGEAREGVLEDVLRFYEFFDIRLQEADRDYPDHLGTELEFMAFLSQREDAAQASGKDAEPFRQAARDFLQRHVLAWVPGFAERLGKGETIYGEIARELAVFCQEHAAEFRELEEGVFL